jgi:hypothetical protein
MIHLPRPNQFGFTRWKSEEIISQVSLAYLFTMCALELNFIDPMSYIPLIS